MGESGEGICGGKARLVLLYLEVRIAKDPQSAKYVSLISWARTTQYDIAGHLASNVTPAKHSVLVSNIKSDGSSGLGTDGGTRRARVICGIRGRLSTRILARFAIRWQRSTRG